MQGVHLTFTVAQRHDGAEGKVSFDLQNVGPDYLGSNPALLPTSSVTLGKGFHISEPHLPHP